MPQEPKRRLTDISPGVIRILFRKILRVAVGAPMFGLFVLMTVLAPQRLHAAPIAVFGREAFFTLSASDITALKNSGFNTVILFVVDVEANGDLNYNGNHLIVTNGVYMGDPNWGARLAALKQAPTTINRIEFCTGGAGAQSWVNIKNLIASQGTNSGSILYRNFLAMKNALGVEAICNDDEVAYDASSAATFNRMITSLGMKNTLCPYNNSGYWQSIFNNSAIDAIYLQCYDGGAGNNPATWNGYFGGFKVCPGDWYFNSVATVESRFANWSPVISGGFMWQFEYLGNNLNGYATAIKKAVDPLVITPSSGFSGIAAYNQRVFPSSTPLVLSNAGPTALSWTVVNTSAWLSVSSVLGTLPAGTASNVTVSLNTTTATNLPAGTYSASLVFSNSSTGIMIARRFSLNTAVANWPVACTGFNAAILASNSATAGTPTATAFDVPNNYCFYQSGLGGGTRGLPGDGVFTSLADSATAFRLGPYGVTNALMTGATYGNSGTLTLTNPEAYNSLAILASSANGGGQGTCVLNFNDGTQSAPIAFNAQDWFFVATNVALQGFGRVRLGGSLAIEDNGDSNPNLYQTTINLAVLGLTKPIASLTFTKPIGGTTAILAVSGMPNSIPVAPPPGLRALPGTNATVQLTWSPSAGATNYFVKSSSVSGSNYVTVGQTTATNFIVGGLANGSTYYFVVTAVGTVSESANSSQVSAMPGSYLGWAINPNLLAYWPLNETSGSIASDVIRGSNGAYGGSYSFTTSGAVGAGFGSPHRAVFYNGSSAYTQIPRLIGATNFSIVFWVRTSATAGGGQWYNGSGLVDGEVGGATGDFGVALVGNKVGFGVGNPDTTLASTTAINNGVWHQVAVTRDAGSGQMSIFIDGGGDASMVGPTGIRTNPPNLRLGSLQTGVNFFNGYLSDVAVYDRVLTTNQIATLYSAATGRFYDVTLTNQMIGGILRLSWPGNGKLLEAANLVGPWTTNPAVSPVNIVPSLPQQFYRIRTH